MRASVSSLRRPAPVVVLATALVIGALGAPVTASANSFMVTCTSSHVATDDPIVHPGRAGASHLHEFFGARTAAAASTTASLERSATSCRHARDTAAYWTPTLEVNGTRVRGTLQAYYGRNGKPRAAAPPRGLRVVVGDAHAMSPQPLTTTSWQCIGRGRATRTREVPACRPGERLGAWLLFPDCWDGRRLDSADHRAHLARAVRGRCPDSHPAPIMRLAVLVTWPVRPAGGRGVTLADGVLGANGMHGDFWNAWHVPTLRQLRWDCIEVARACGELRTPTALRATGRRY